MGEKWLARTTSDHYRRFSTKSKGETGLSARSRSFWERFSKLFMIHGSQRIMKWGLFGKLRPILAVD
jgi:hypothetical protein